jgi:DNA-binding HxlR family transcriptional regulator
VVSMKKVVITMTPGDAPAAGRAEARRSLCPVACALDVVGDRWTLLVIRDLLGGKRRFGDFVASAEKIPTNILADRLKRLERAGLVARVPYSNRPPRVEYHLTPEGRKLGRAVDALATWGLTHCPGTVRTIWPSTKSEEAHADTTNEFSSGAPGLSRVPGAPLAAVNLERGNPD